jgi:hypothetical protein
MVKRTHTQCRRGIQHSQHLTDASAEGIISDMLISMFLKLIIKGGNVASVEKRRGILEFSNSVFFSEKVNNQDNDEVLPHNKQT